MNLKISYLLKYIVNILIIITVCELLFASSCIAPNSLLDNGLIFTQKNDSASKKLDILTYIERYIKPTLDSVFKIHNPYRLNSDARILLLFKIKEIMLSLNTLGDEDVILDSFFCHENIVYFHIINEKSGTRKVIGINFSGDNEGYSFNEAFALNRSQFLNLRKYAIEELKDDDAYQFLWKGFLKYFNETISPKSNNKTFSLAEIDVLIHYWDKYIRKTYDNPAHPIAAHSSWRIFWLFNSLLYDLSLENQTSGIRETINMIKTGLIKESDLDDMNETGEKTKEINELELYLHDISRYFMYNRSWGNRHLEFHKDHTFPVIEAQLSNARTLRVLCPGDMMGMQSLTILDEILTIIKRLNLDIEDFEIEIVVEDLEEKISRKENFIYPFEDIEHIKHKSFLLQETDILSSVIGEAYRLSDFAKKYIQFEEVDLNYVNPKNHVHNPFDTIFISKTVEYLTNVKNAHQYLINSVKQKPYGKLFYIDSPIFPSELIINYNLISSQLHGLKVMIEKAA